MKLLLLFIFSHCCFAECLDLVKPMLDTYSGEQYQNLEYVHPDDLYKYEVHFREGLLLNYKGRKITTRSGLFKDSSIFVLSPEGKMYYSNFNRDHYFHHSSFLRGGPVAMAGRISVVKGRVIFVSNNSGHYQPNANMFAQFFDFLSRNKVVTKRIGKANFHKY